MTELDRIALLVPEARAFVVRVAEQLRAEGYTVQIVSTRRTCAEQARLYEIGRSTPGQIVTHARGCHSWHVLGRAADFRILGGPTDAAGAYRRLGELARENGGKWGGDFKGFQDLPHVEFHPDQTIEQACPDPSKCVDGASSGNLGSSGSSGASGSSGGAVLALLALAGLAWLVLR